MDPLEVRHEQAVVPATPPPPAAPVAATPVSSQPYGTGVVTRTGIYPAGYRAIQTVWFVIGVINAILAFDFVLRLLAANNVGFAHLMYVLGRVFGTPFDGIFNMTVVDGVYVVRWSDLLAIAVYSLIGWGITKLIRIMSTPSTPAVA
jgi:hypothetical protein